ncbi:MAG TPA: chemotaxis protein CheD [Oculatellaceae cyanobacterium]|jgi:chemotaxis protein CheD
MTMQQTDTVGLGELKLSSNKAQVFMVPNIGTGLAVVIYDPVKKLGGAAHIVLPESAMASPTAIPGAPNLPAKFADQAIPKILEAFEQEGGSIKNCVIRIAGGSQLFNFGGGSGNILNVGARNIAAVEAALAQAGLTVAKKDTGGNKSRTLRFVLATGQVFVKQIGGQEYPL